MAPLESRPSLTRTRNLTTHYSPLTTYYSLAHHSLLTAHCSPVIPSTRDMIINASKRFVGTRSPGPVPEYSISPQGCENLSLEWLDHASMAKYNRLVAEGNRVQPVVVAGAVADTPAVRLFHPRRWRRTLEPLARRTRRCRSCTQILL
jgi:hypothetical protein